jgi:hypothetical protein
MIPQECGSGNLATIIQKVGNECRIDNKLAMLAQQDGNDTTMIRRHGSHNCSMMSSIIFQDKLAWKLQLLNDEQYNLSR